MSKKVFNTNNKKIPKIIIRNVDDKILDSKSRLRSFLEWKPSAALVSTRNRCISYEKSNIKYLEEYRDSKKNQWKEFIGSVSNINIK